ncbi:hypothetical protein ON010_g12317 [Phytophthora cinnamomi]|nr:hypothetical protein ON010_g12317 [Phytophthora cinnamomi]
MFKTHAHVKWQLSCWRSDHGGVDARDGRQEARGLGGAAEEARQEGEVPPPRRGRVAAGGGSAAEAAAAEAAAAEEAGGLASQEEAQAGAQPTRRGPGHHPGH